MNQKIFQNNRLRFVAYFFLILALLIISRLFYLQVWQHQYFLVLAAKGHDLRQKISPHRGSIYFKDARTGEKSVAAIDKDYYTLFINPREISFDKINVIGERISTILNITDDEQKRSLFDKLSRHTTTYQLIAKKIPEEVKNQIDTMKSDLKMTNGIYTGTQTYRFYPENTLASTILGFGARPDETKPLIGKYGIEGYWNEILTGTDGLVSGEKSVGGSWITLAGRTIVPAKDGADVVLTIDRNLEYQACDKLREWFEKTQAKDASLIMMNPKTGAILAMCSFPDFDPNNYGAVSSTEQFNNTSIFTPYEPGSVFKPITMSMALDLGLVTQNTQVTGYQYLCKFPIPGSKKFIPNAGGACYTPAQHFPSISTTDVLIHSINTGMVWVAQQLGKDNFRVYLNKFGLPEKTGISLDVEAKGNIESIVGARSQQEINTYYAAFGQSITVTPIQLAMMYSALANNGKLLRPYIVDSVQYSNGEVQKTSPQLINPQDPQVISPRTSALITGMLVATANSPDYRRHVHVPGYEVAEKTGTAQIIKNGVVQEPTNHTVTGFAPANDPQIVLVVKLGQVEQKKGGSPYAEGDAGPAFQSIMLMALKYFNIPEIPGKN
jgi:cell division protein FtsI/penicillin-binding protein 2